MADDLINFLRARFDEDHEDALRGYLTAPDDPGYSGWDKKTTAGLPPLVVKRMLAEVEAKRRLLKRFAPEPREPETDTQLHARFAHPNWEYRTTEGQRKAWDDADTPPLDDNFDPDPTWERNIDAGRDGWDRFDYTEESYWRRRLPTGQERQPYTAVELRLLTLPYANHPDCKPEWRP